MTDHPDDDELWLVCGVSEPGESARIPGSIPDRCTKCMRAIWVAPSGQKKVAAGLVAAKVCVHCFVDDTRPNKIVLPIEDEQVAEIIEARKRAAFRYN